MNKLPMPLLFIAFFMAACSSSPEVVLQTAETQDQEGQVNLAPTSPGIIKIQRKGEDYDVQLELDVGTDNVVFVMDMPGNIEVKKDGETIPLTEEKPPIEKRPAEDGAKIPPPITPPLLDDTNKELDANLVTSNIIRSQKLFYQGRYFDSMAAIDQALALAPKNAVANAIKGSVFYQLGDRKQAAYYWQTALQLDPSLDDVRDGLKSLNMGAN